MRIYLFCIGAMILFSAGKVSAQIIPLPSTDHQHVIIAHRGNHVDVPENTLAAYEAAIRCGADYVEVDVRGTADGHLVAVHDETITKMTGIDRKVEEMTWDEIRSIPVIPVRDEDVREYYIPDFASILELCRDRIRIYLDFKKADVRQTYEMIKGAQMEDHIVVYVNSIDQYKEWREVTPAIPLMTSLPWDMDRTDLEKMLAGHPVSVVDNAREKEQIQWLKDRGVAVWLDVQGKEEGPERWEDALRLGVDGMQSDRPDELIQYLEEKGIR